MRRKRKKSLGRGLMHLLFRLALLGAVCFGLALGALYLLETHVPAPSGNSDALIVLGAQVYPSGELSPQLELRMEAALAAYQAQPRPLILCGAQGANEPLPEGEAMRRWLLARGVPQADMQAETASRNTQENLQNACALLPAGARRVTIITSDYHLPRALRIAHDLGLEADGVGSPCKPEFWLKNHCREVLAWGKYVLSLIK